MKNNEFKSKYTKKEITLRGLQLVGYAGDARSSLLEAVKEAKAFNFEKVEALLKEADENLLLAHRSQTDMLMQEASGEYSDLTLTMIHGQDHLMTTILLKDIIETLIDVYKNK